MGNYFQSNSQKGNVVFNFRNNSISDINAYALGYHRSATVLVDNLKSKNGFADYDAYPIFYLYRHSLELYLKSIIFRGACLTKLINDKEVDKSRLFKEHQLSKLLPIFEELLDSLKWTDSFSCDGIKSFDEFKEIINELDSSDPKSYNFRYPVDTQGDSSLPRHFILNIYSFSQIFDPLLNLLNGIYTQINIDYDLAAETWYNFNQLFSEYNVDTAK
jgi:hypothetical protein